MAACQEYFGIEQVPDGHHAVAVVGHCARATVERRGDNRRRGLSAPYRRGRRRRPWGTTAVHTDVAVIATNGHSPEVGLSTPDLAEAAVKRAMVAGARRVMLVADSSKYCVRHFARFGVLDDVDILVIDTGLTDRQAAEISTHGPEVLRV
ncbi:hypothetical protein [Kitasatospora sp. NPDC001132]